jgi:D-arabinose 1-dehydrogenase-like Zn-dependent alcohol dehydrogenase
MNVKTKTQNTNGGAKKAAQASGPTMKAVQVGQKGGAFEVVEKEVPQPGRGEVRIQVKACGICHSDVLTKEGLWGGIQYPRCPGHEVAGVVDALGEGVTAWKKGQRVGLGWAGRHCGEGEACRRGDFVLCARLQVSGIHFDGGYADYVIAPDTDLAAIPDELSFEEAAPILCAGVTTFNALRNAGAQPPALVAVQGIGGLGHLGIQFANKMGYRVAAISKGKDKEALARKLGAHDYIDSEQGDPAAQLKALGGARVILATAPSGKSMTSLLNGLGLRGVMMVIGAGPDPIEVSAFQLIPQEQGLHGWASGSAVDSEDTLKFCAITGVRPMIETFPLEKAAEAFDRVMANKVRFRAVLVH